MFNRRTLRDAEEKVVRSPDMAAKAVVFAGRHYWGRSDDCLGRGTYQRVGGWRPLARRDFDAQFHRVFSNIGKTLAETGCKLTEIVIMTVFLIDACYMTRMTELRTALFGGDRFFPPAPRSRWVRLKVEWMGVDTERKARTTFIFKLGLTALPLTAIWSAFRQELPQFLRMIIQLGVTHQ
jgi:hypothetical protein